MIKELKRIIMLLVLLIPILILFYVCQKINKTVEAKEADLVIYGDNIATTKSTKPFIEDNGVYIAYDTIAKLIDPNIFYDKVATKIIVTTKDEVIKFKIDESKMSKNMEYVDITTPAKIKEEMAFVDINLLKDIYHIKVEYNKQTNTISIDKINTSDIKVKYNRVNVYTDLSTASDVLQRLDRKNTVTVYSESLTHNRWYKVKTDSGVIGYISKNNVDLLSAEKEPSSENEEKPAEQANPKYTMFWQYGSDLNTLGSSKIEGVNVVSPTWYELKNANGELSSKFSKEYYDKAKSMGYDIWPIITNGIDSTSYTAADTSAMLNSEYSREQFIKNIVQTAKEHKIDGLNIDFEAMREEDKNLYTQFIRELAPLLRKENIVVSVDMYFVNYIARRAVGEASDYVVLMGYDQRGAWSNVPGSIAEVSWVEENIESLINDSNIPSHKIILGVPFYTRLWTVKEGDIKPKTTVYTMKNCQTFLKEHNLTTTWDEKAGQNYAEYKSGITTYKLWIEDKDSIKRRVETVNKYNLAGITGWRKGLETSDIWEVIHENLKK